MYRRLFNSPNIFQYNDTEFAIFVYFKIIKDGVPCSTIRSSVRTIVHWRTFLCSNYSAIVNEISKLKWFKKNIAKWSDKKLAVFCCGASPIDNPEIGRDLPKNFTEEELKAIRWFYCPGGLNYEKMSVTSKVPRFSRQVWTPSGIISSAWRANTTGRLRCWSWKPPAMPSASP